MFAYFFWHQIYQQNNKTHLIYAIVMNLKKKSLIILTEAQLLHCGKLKAFCSATVPSAGVQLPCLPFMDPYSKSSSSSKLNTPRSGSCRFHGTYLKKK